jgi:hypothetical protein
LNGALAMPTTMPTAATFASNLDPFTAALLSHRAPQCDLRHRIFLAEVNPGFKEFSGAGYFLATPSRGSNAALGQELTAIRVRSIAQLTTATGDSAV